MTGMIGMIASVITLIVVAMLVPALLTLRRKLDALASLDRVRYALDCGDDPRKDPRWPAVVEEFIYQQIGFDVIAWYEDPYAPVHGWRARALAIARQKRPRITVEEGL